jgi:hypothetical protein
MSSPAIGSGPPQRWKSSGLEPDPRTLSEFAPQRRRAGGRRSDAVAGWLQELAVPEAGAPMRLRGGSRNVAVPEAGAPMRLRGGCRNVAVPEAGAPIQRGTCSPTTRPAVGLSHSMDRSRSNGLTRDRSAGLRHGDGAGPIRTLLFVRLEWRRQRRPVRVRRSHLQVIWHWVGRRLPAIAGLRSGVRAGNLHTR